MYLASFGAARIVTSNDGRGQLHDTYGKRQDHKADATDSQQTGEPGPVPR